jgi:hypothetical protein
MMTKNNSVNLCGTDKKWWLMSSRTFALDELNLWKPVVKLHRMPYNTFCGGEYVFQLLVATSTLVCSQRLRCINISCAQVLAQPIEFKTIGYICSWLGYSPIAPPCLYILLTEGCTLGSAPKWLCSHGEGHKCIPCYRCGVFNIYEC